jgi:response regulator RpfG family c-di-GMP phosphodiesterase
MYLVTELVDGGDLEHHVKRRGPCSISEACNYIRQAAAGLQAAHDRHLIHRDIKPSNLLLTTNGQVKLVDFGLARQFSSQLTDPRSLLGSIEFMPPEQSHDPSAVGKEADIYGLGATLFWLLTFEGPYPAVPHIGQALRILQEQEPRQLRSLRPDVPQPLADLIQQMLARNPSRRPSSPTAVSNALRPFLIEGTVLLPESPVQSPVRDPNPDRRGVPRVLIVDDEMRVRMAHRMLLEPMGCDCTEARDVRGSLDAAAGTLFDLVILDLNLPDDEGRELCRRLRALEGNPNLKVIGVAANGQSGESQAAGADDYLIRPYENAQFLTRVRQALNLKSAQDRCARLAEQLAAVNRQLEESLHSRNADLREAHNALLFTVARIAESRDGETADHLKRMQAYTRTLALELASAGGLTGAVNGRFLEQLERCVPLHDIGKIGLPDEILLKPASLSQPERDIVETHPLIGDQLLDALAREHGSGLDFLGMARMIVRSHHERWDGKGYPDKLAGEKIPLAARLVAIADVYDTLRRMRMYKPAMSHGSAIRLMLDRSDGQFDPKLLQALGRCHAEFERIYREITG